MLYEELSVLLKNALPILKTFFKKKKCPTYPENIF